MNQTNKVVYFHVKKSDPSHVFYIGYGTPRRPYIKSKRNNKWQKIVAKHGYEIHIVADNLTIEQAIDLEIFLTLEWKSAGMAEAVFIIGSDKGSIMTDETRKKISVAKQNPSIETRNKISLSRKGKSSWNKGRIVPHEERENIRQKLIGHKRTKESIDKQMATRKAKGIKNPMHSLSAREKHSGANSPRARKVICLNTNIIYDTVKLAAEYANVTYSAIIACINGQHKSSGIHPITKERLSWKYATIE